MEEGDPDPPSTTLHDARRKHGRSKILAPRQGRTAKVKYEELFRRTGLRIAGLFSSGQVRIEGMREAGSKEALNQLKTLREMRDHLVEQLGPTRVPLGFVNEIHHHGVAFLFAPFFEWGELYHRLLEWSGPTAAGPNARRDFLIWMLWHFRRRAIVQRGRLPNKIRGGATDCVQCGHRHRIVERTDWANRRLLGCPKCGCPTHRPVRMNIKYVPYGKITKKELRRRFRVSERHLVRVLAARPPSGDSQNPASSATNLDSTT